MKKIILFTSCLLLLAGCVGGNIARSGGLDSEAGLQFVQGGAATYSGGVEVYIDDNPMFKAQVDNVNKYTLKKGKVYTIKHGTRHVKVVYKGRVLFDKTIVLGTQETKQIQLP